MEPEAITSPFSFFTNLRDYFVYYKQSFLQSYQQRKERKKEKKLRHRFVKGLGELKTFAGHEVKNLPLCKAMGGNINSVLKRSKDERVMLPMKLSPNWKIRLDPNIFKSADLLTKSSCIALVKVYPFGMISYQMRIYLASERGIDLRGLITLMRSIKERDVLITNRGRFNALSIMKKFDEIILKDFIAQDFVPEDRMFSPLHRILTITSVDPVLNPENNRKELAALVGLMPRWNKLSTHYVKKHLGMSLAGILEDQFFFFHPSCTIIYPANPAIKPEFDSYVRRCIRTNFTSIVEAATLQSQFARALRQSLEKLLNESPYTSERKEELRLLLDRIKGVEWLLKPRYFDQWLEGAHEDFYHIIEKMIGLENRVQESFKKLNEFKEELKGDRQTLGKPITILFLAANPVNTQPLRLDEEMRSIDQALLQARFRDKFDLEQQWAIRVDDLQSHLLRYKPTIVHFSGHGSKAGEIILEDIVGNSHATSAEALSDLFSILKDDIQLVVLNACYSETQAKAIVEHIDCVIGMSKTIGDAAAINFAKSFYQALGYGKDVETAFKLGCNQIDLKNLNEQDTPKILWKNNKQKKIVFVDSV